IDAVSGLPLAPCGDVERVIYQQDVEARSVHAIDRQRCAIKRYRTLRRYEARKFARRFKRIADGVALRLALDDRRHAVDMTRDDVTTEFVANLQRTFQV